MEVNNSLVWFRKSLRITDNIALSKACSLNGSVYPIFILDPNFRTLKIGANRWRFLFESLNDLDRRLKSKGSRLLLAQGKPTEIMDQLIKQFNINSLFYEVDTEPYSIKRDSEIDALCKQRNVKVFRCSGHTLYDLDKLYEFNQFQVTLTYQSFLNILQKFGKPDKPIPEPQKIYTPAIKQYQLISLSESGIDFSEIGEQKYPGGETEAIKRMDKKLSNEIWVRQFEKPKTSPNSLEPSTTVLSPYLKFGCLSPRIFYYKLEEIYSKAEHSQPPCSLHGQLLWREFFYFVGAFTKNFDKIEGNKICKQIQWDQNKEYLERWTKAQTGFPFIDAIMTQLRIEGWIHHLARHAVACFLTRGDLYQSWVEGAKVFDELLLDADWSLNNANWMWLSCSSFFYQYYRVYSPISFGKSTDPNGDYIRKYIPILKNYPKEFIFEPWKASLDIQKKCKCIIGIDYPSPIVDHDLAKEKCLERMKSSYQKGTIKQKQIDETPFEIKKKIKNLT